jgi:uncharacterized protein YjbI with pentapeptide repeats
MNQQPPQRSVLHALLSVLTRKAPEQAKQHVQPPQRPAPDDYDAWHAYWEAQDQSWRTEPEIDTKRQKELERCRAIKPDIERGIYPFSGMKLSRADVEWLLITLENGRGPVDWNDEKQKGREGLDLRRVNVRQVNLSGLPLARLRGSTTVVAGKLPRDYDINSALHAEGASFENAHLEDAHLSYAHLKEAVFAYAHLEGVDLSLASLEEAVFAYAHLEDADLSAAVLEGALFIYAQMKTANLYVARLEKTDFGHGWLEKANLQEAHLQDANLEAAHLEGAYLGSAHLEGAKLCSAFFDQSTNLERVILENKALGCASLADIHWGDVNVSVVDWSQVTVLGDEQRARRRDEGGKTKESRTRVDEYQTRIDEHLTAVRANRQLAIVLQNQGLNEDAMRFAYHAQVLQRRAVWFQMTQPNLKRTSPSWLLASYPRIKLWQRVKSLGAWLFSWFLFLLAGYGYKPGRSFLAYLLVIGTFMALYLFLDPHLAWYEAIVVSMTAFHGRGFSPSTFSPGDPLSIASAVEAFVGLIIEVTFIATLTRRFFGQ